MNDFIELLKILGELIIGSLIIVLLIMICVAYPIEAYKCSGIQKATGMETNMVNMSCYVKVDGKFVPSEVAFQKQLSVEIK